MATAKTIIELAESQVGIKESPANSNRVKYNKEYYGYNVSGSAYPWCCVFVWWVFNHADASKLFYSGKKTALCATLMSWFKSQGRFYTKNPKPGDIVFFNWVGGSVAKHVGIVKSYDSKTGKVTTIEGNTSVGNDSNGGQVMIRERTRGCILGYGRPAYGIDNTTVDYYSDTTTYRTTGNLYLRSAASKSSSAKVTIPNNTIVRRLDSTSKIANRITWYHVQVTIKSKTYKGYCSAKYLTKV